MQWRWISAGMGLSQIDRSQLHYLVRQPSWSKISLWFLWYYRELHPNLSTRDAKNNPTCTGLVSSSSRFTSHCACCKNVLPNETEPHEGYGKPELWWPKASERIRQVQNVEPAQDDRWGELPSLMYDTVLVKTAHVAPSLCHRDTFTLHRTIKKLIFGVQKHHQSHQEPS